jgi:hypothetical protein
MRRSTAWIRFSQIGRSVSTCATYGVAERESVSPMCPRWLRQPDGRNPEPVSGLVRHGIPNGIRTRAAALKGEPRRMRGWRLEREMAHD